jgi:hypothetical protein
MTTQTETNGYKARYQSDLMRVLTDIRMDAQADAKMII